MVRQKIIILNQNKERIKTMKQKKSVKYYTTSEIQKMSKEKRIKIAKAIWG